MNKLDLVLSRIHERKSYFSSVVHESPRWLIQKGKIKEARHVLQRIQHIDGQKEAKRDEMEKMLDVAYQVSRAPWKIIA